MARRSHRARRHLLEDLEPYHGCRDDSEIGLEPLAVGWLRRGRPFEQGEVPARFVEQLARHCQPEFAVCQVAGRRPCPICGQLVEGSGAGEIRVIGNEEVYAAPDLILHYVEAHNYRPPRSFIEDVLVGPPPDSSEHRALRSAYR